MFSDVKWMSFPKRIIYMKAFQMFKATPKPHLELYRDDSRTAKNAKLAWHVSSSTNNVDRHCACIASTDITVV